MAEQNWFRWLAQQIPWSTTNDLLEVGCGTGLLWNCAPSEELSNAKITLTDRSSFIVNATVDVATQTFAHVRGVVANVEELPFCDEAFDLVVANHMPYHASDRDLAIREIVRVLRPRGTLIESTNGQLNLVELYEIEKAVFGVAARSELVEAFGSLSGVPILNRCFNDVSWRLHVGQLLCTNVPDVVSYLTSMPPGSEASLDRCEELRAEVERQMKGSGGVLAVTKQAGVFIAKLPRPRI